MLVLLYQLETKDYIYVYIIYLGNHHLLLIVKHIDALLIINQAWTKPLMLIFIFVHPVLSVKYKLFIQAGSSFNRNWWHRQTNHDNHANNYPHVKATQILSPNWLVFTKQLDGQMALLISDHNLAERNYTMWYHKIYKLSTDTNLGKS